jgi:Protein of unknown function (DUF3617)
MLASLNLSTLLLASVRAPELPPPHAVVCLSLPESTTLKCPLVGLAALSRDSRRSLFLGRASVDNGYTEVHLITKSSLGIVFLLACGTIGWAADTFHPLDVKTGEWESTTTVATSDVPPIPVEALARMTPEQRSRLEEQTKSLSGRTIVHKFCLKKEKLDKPISWGNADKACTTALVTSTGSMQEIHVECNRNNRKSTGTMRFEARDSENIKGTVKMSMTSANGNMDINSTFTAKWTGETCSADN